MIMLYKDDIECVILQWTYHQMQPNLGQYNAPFSQRFTVL